MSGGYYGPDRQDYKSGLSWVAWAVVIALAAGFLLIVGHFALGWLAAPADIYGVDNVRAQYKDAYDNYASLGAIAANVCGARRVLADTPQGSADHGARQTQLTAQEQNFARVSAQYNAAFADAFRAKNVKPGDLPDQAPPLTYFTQRSSACN